MLLYVQQCDKTCFQVVDKKKSTPIREHTEVKLRYRLCIAIHTKSGAVMRTVTGRHSLLGCTPKVGKIY